MARQHLIRWDQPLSQAKRETRRVIREAEREKEFRGWHVEPEEPPKLKPSPLSLGFSPAFMEQWVASMMGGDE